MRTRTVLLLLALAAGIAAAAPGESHAQDRKASRPQPRPGAPTGGTLGILPHGTWECALPGDAGGPAFEPIEEEGFLISTASSYRSPGGGRGIYLLRGTEVVFTRGPKKDQRFRVRGENTLQKLNPDGTDSKLVCTRIGNIG
ncbi:elongation factor P [Erythrobacter sp. WG]|uniref:elongation factor P n=1 Tax=Erythrobacter sp. WG TaxID=2985510 RepID=UPI00226F0AB2|nr:elongation factor P [Erythrobacter sp. WG]MCX9147878.1 elongation factor P [Erythrobacter sp. WG]